MTRSRFASTPKEFSKNDVNLQRESFTLHKQQLKGSTKMATKMSRSSLLLASAVVGMMAFAGTPGSVSADDAGKVNCYGVNKCKGSGACGGKGHSCAGENSCKGHGYLKIDKDTCLKIEGGRLTPQAK